jgi:hypothetical protein
MAACVVDQALSVPACAPVALRSISGRLTDHRIPPALDATSQTAVSDEGTVSAPCLDVQIVGAWPVKFHKAGNNFATIFDDNNYARERAGQGTRIFAGVVPLRFALDGMLYERVVKALARGHSSRICSMTTGDIRHE